MQACSGSWTTIKKVESACRGLLVQDTVALAAAKQLPVHTGDCSNLSMKNSAAHQQPDDERRSGTGPLLTCRPRFRAASTQCCSCLRAAVSRMMPSSPAPLAKAIAA